MARTGMGSWGWIALVLFATPAAADVLDDLRALPGVTAQETTQAFDPAQGLRRFAVQIDQPVDHFNPAAGKFRQRLVLFHRGYGSPMVLQTSGYKIFAESLSRIAQSFPTNQLQVEHRYFGESLPAAPMDWSKLTVRQSAEDFHRITQTFRKLYAGHWVGTGASKGGMTSTYHRRFFPADLDGTVADVAPLSFARQDERYVDFVLNAGGPKYAQCRRDLNDFQRTLLRRRAELLPRLEGEYTLLGGKDVSFEHAVIEMTFTFWQYGNPEDEKAGCAQVPSANAPASELMAFLKEANDPKQYGDADLKGFQPYFFQAALELGGPASPLAHIRDMLTHPYNLEMYLPRGTSAPYAPATMLDVHDWVARESTGMIFVYGEFDPWSAAAYRDINAAPGSDNHWYQVPGGNHGSKFTQLPTAQRAEATNVLARWLGTQPSRILRAVPALEDLELQALRRGVR